MAAERRAPRRTGVPIAGDHAEGDGVHRDLLRPDFAGERALEAHRTGLAAAVDRHPHAEPLASGVRGDRDDASMAPLAHAREHGVDPVQHRVEIDVDVFLPVARIHVDELGRNRPRVAAVARVRDEDVDGTQRRLDRGDHRLDAFEIRHVPRRRNRPAARLHDCIRDVSRARRHDVVDRDGGALPREGFRDRAAHVLPRARHERDSSRQIEHQGLSSPGSRGGRSQPNPADRARAARLHARTTGVPATRAPDRVRRAAASG